MVSKAGFMVWVAVIFVLNVKFSKKKTQLSQIISKFEKSNFLSKLNLLNQFLTSAVSFFLLIISCYQPSVSNIL